MTDTDTSQNTDLSSWIILYRSSCSVRYYRPILSKIIVCWQNVSKIPQRPISEPPLSSSDLSHVGRWIYMT